jgi:uncharacterized protein
MEKIVRDQNTEATSFRAFEENGEKYLEGYASVFNKKSKRIFENNKLFLEVINSRAFDEVLKGENLDVILTLNHDSGRGIIARTKSGTLSLSTDDYGLRFKCSLPNTTLANDVYELVSRKDLNECSFAFAIRKGDDEWSKDENGLNIRTINKIARLYDVSIVVNGAYANTDVFARDNEEIIESETPIKEPEEKIEAKSEEVPVVEVPKIIEEPKNDRAEIEQMIMHLKILKIKK